MPFEYIWFDLGYTLLYREREAKFAKTLASLGFDVSIEAVDRGFHFVDKLYMRDFPGVLGGQAEDFMPGYMEKLCSHLGVDCEKGGLLRLWDKAWAEPDMEWKAYPFVPSTLETLKALGLKLGVISNWDPSAKPILRRCGLAGFFEHIVISCEVGVSKPDKGIFQIALDAAKTSAFQCLYVGDNYYDDAVGASSVGMESLIINRFGTFGVEELKGMTIIRDIAEIPGILAKRGGSPA
ncbi:MAG: putative hydrolase of the HAD superfamily [Spirochaetes bacterium]|nr:MAG: putative hydrolase of the HAD superfamily [Spirochaetota bacterium]